MFIFFPVLANAASVNYDITNFLVDATILDNGDIAYDEDNVNVKKNFMNMVKEFMQMQYDNNNLAGYLSYKKFYDYMIDSHK